MSNLADEAAVKQLAVAVWEAMMADEVRVAQFCGKVLSTLADDPKMKGLVRDIALTVYASTDKLTREGYVRTLVRACKDAGAGLHVNAAGALIVTNRRKMTDDQLDAIKTYRADLIEVLRANQPNRAKR